MDGSARRRIQGRRGDLRPIGRLLPAAIPLCFVWFASAACSGGGDGGAAVHDSALDVAPDTRHVPQVGDPCTDLSQCDDGIFCDGVEECVGGRCSGPRNAACRDRGGCATSTCVESRGCVVDIPSTTTCAAGEVCLPELGCSAPEGCTSDATCDDGVACTDDRCDTPTKRCLHVAVDEKCSAVGVCGVGVCLGADASDPSGCGLLPDATKCAPNEGCTPSGACAPLPPTCTTDADCTDDNLCDGVERCITGLCSHDPAGKCAPSDACHHVTCRDRALGAPYCLSEPVPGCS